MQERGRTDHLLTDPGQMAAWWRAVARPGEVFEARIPKTRRDGPRRLYGVVSGYFNDEAAFVRALSPIRGADAEGVYLTLNPVNPDLLARACNRLAAGVPGTQDADVVERRHLLIDVDPRRPSGISATDDERDAALARRDAIAAALAALGWPPPAATLATGNGGGLLYRVRLANDAAALDLVARTLRGLAAAFDDERVTIDTSIANAARIAKVPGTVAAKGDPLPSRPWRLATAAFGADPLPVPPALLEAVAAAAPERGGPAGPAFGGDLAERLRAAGIGFRATEKGWATVYTLDRCLTSADHAGDTATALFVFPSGAIAYRCLHNRCADKRWADVREQLGYGARAAGPRLTIGGREPGAAAPAPGAPPAVAEDPRDAVIEQTFAPPPAAVYYGWFGAYVDLMAPTTEAPDQYHLAAALTMAGALIGRRAAMEWFSEALYPNLYTVLIGRTGSSRKDTAIKRALALPQRPLGTTLPPECPFAVARDVSSAEGLIQVLSERPNTLLYLTELTALLANARRKGTRTIIDRLIEAWDTPEILQNLTKNNPIYARRPYLSILAATQPGRLADNMSEEDIHSGFANRWLYVTGSGKETMPRAPAVDWAAAWHAYRDLLDAVAAYPEGTMVGLAPAAERRWDAWYLGEIARPGRDEAEDDMRSRHPNLAVKVALIYAVSDGARQVEARHLDPAIALVEWTWGQVRELMRFWGVGIDSQIAQRIVNQIRRHGPMTRRDLQRATSGRKWGPREFAAVFEAMARNGTIAADERGRFGFPQE